MLFFFGAAFPTFISVHVEMMNLVRKCTLIQHSLIKIIEQHQYIERDNETVVELTEKHMVLETYTLHLHF